MPTASDDRAGIRASGGRRRLPFLDPFADEK
jgi:hypothetical protein